MAKRRIPISEVCPIVQQAPRNEGGAIVLDAGESEVRVEGDPKLVGEVLGRCDGRTTVAAIASAFNAEAEVEDLVSSLLELGVLVDGADAWRHFHRLSSLGSGIGRILGDDAVTELVAERFVPSRLSDRAETLRPRQTALWQLSGQRRSSAPQGGERPVSFEELSLVLGTIYGRSEAGHQPIPSAGGIYPLVLHALLRNPLRPLEAGLWWYDPDRLELRAVRAERLQVSELFLSHPVTDPLLALGHPIVFVSADFERPARKYSNRGYRFALIEAGAALQSAYLTAAELDLPVRGIGGIVDRPLREFLELPEDCHPLLAVALGS